MASIRVRSSAFVAVVLAAGALVDTAGAAAVGQSARVWAAVLMIGVQIL